MLKFSTQKHHWNYFLAIEKDLEIISRYIEFCETNQQVHSIELAHILLSASSEVDVVLKLICNLLDDKSPANNIDNYKEIIQLRLPDFINEEISINRFGIIHKPWENWNGEENPGWWRSYNKVKHQRNDYFTEANLKNVLNAVGALLISIVYYYKLTFTNETGVIVSFREVTHNLKPGSSFLTINNPEYYDQYLII